MKDKEARVLNRIFPGHIDNQYRGLKPAIWLFVPITFMRVAISMVHIFSDDGGAQSISTIPLDTYTSGASANLIALFAHLGLDQLLIGLLFVVVLFRYRAMIPLMYVLIIAGYIGLEGIAMMKPIVTTGTSGANLPHLVLMTLSIIGLVLSLIGKGYLNGRESGTA